MLIYEECGGSSTAELQSIIDWITEEVIGNFERGSKIGLRTYIIRYTKRTETFTVHSNRFVLVTSKKYNGN